GAPSAAAVAQLAPAAGEVEDATLHLPGVQGALRPWALVAVAFALLWLLTLAWAFSRRGGAREPSPAPSTGAIPNSDPRALRRALDHGDLAGVAETLCALAGVADFDALRVRLDDARQLQAVDALQRARWGAGDATDARSRLRDAFREGPRWRRSPDTRESLLPPLYPE
ncbi:MAG: protein BatD, partial [Lysobacter sp.]|nr:protein BatD [Lysobacter sp.]